MNVIEKIKKLLSELLKKMNWKIVLFSFVILISIFLRVYRFDDFLLFKGDSFRDAVMVDRVYENGIGELPLLGPRAGGSKLRLGPIFYYFQYVSALIFGSTSAPVLAYPNLLFSILTIPVFYLFSRKFFNHDWSMIITSMFSLSFLAMEYSRFTWNPNSAPFFNLLFFYALLEVFDEKRLKYKNWFSALAGLSFAISSQLHFSNFLGLPIILFLFCLVNWKKVRKIISWKYVVIFISMIILVFMPVILNDITTNFSNSEQFLKAVESKPSGSSVRSMAGNILRDGKYFGKYFLRITTGIMHPSSIMNYLMQIFIFIAFVINFFFWKKEGDTNKKNFLLLSGVTFLVYFILYIPLSKEINNPRFFLPLLPIPFIFLGYAGVCINSLSKKSKFIFTGLFFVLIFSMVVSSLRWDLSWLIEINRSQNNVVRQEDTLVMKAKRDRIWWTWGIFEETAKHMKSECQGEYFYYLMAKDVSEFDHSIEYALKEAGNKNEVKIIKKNISYDSQGCYFFISRVGAKISETIKRDKFNFGETKNLGNVAVTQFYFNDPSGEMDEFDKRKASKKGSNNKGHREYWKDLF